MNVEKMARAEVLADNHWDYMSQVYRHAAYSDNEIKELEFIYKAAWLHGVKHVLEEDE